MSTLVSPQITRMLAVAILILILWASARLTGLYLAARLDLHAETVELTDTYMQMAQRRVDIDALQVQLSTLDASPAVRRSTIAAGSARDALNQLMQTTRGSLDKVHGQLLSLTESPTAQGSSAIGVQVRARMEEALVPQWLALIDGGDIHPRVEEISVTAPNDGAGKTMDLEVSATLKMPWTNQKDRRP
jgi:hypothetical protein